MWAVVPQPAPDTIAEMSEKKTNEATGRQWVSSHATNALTTTLSLFHREVKMSLATMDATVGQSSVSGGEAMRL